MKEESHQFTALLEAMRAGDDRAGGQALELVYVELRRMAGRYIRRERREHTLQPTALVHEAYLRMIGSDAFRPNDRTHFLALAATQMRRILVDHARAKDTKKRGATPFKVTLSGIDLVAEQRDESLLDLDRALTELQHADLRSARVIELRFFGGLTEEEIASVLSVSIPTVKRDWRFGRSFLAARLSGSDVAR